MIQVGVNPDQRVAPEAVASACVACDELIDNGDRTHCSFCLRELFDPAQLGVGL